eukprot:gene7335-27578_t
MLPLAVVGNGPLGASVARALSARHPGRVKLLATVICCGIGKGVGDAGR